VINTKTIIIKMIGIMMSAFLIAISCVFYFKPDYRNNLFLVIIFALGIIIFFLPTIYEKYLEKV